mmetsp:Transcript_5577/g.12216  ORF Transcript_5577/g.12216 Transcript_5577/m.12216 type:complete len:234 (-) Transcript_5577:1429-2130(-)
MCMIRAYGIRDLGRQFTLGPTVAPGAGMILMFGTPPSETAPSDPTWPLRHLTSRRARRIRSSNSTPSTPLASPSRTTLTPSSTSRPPGPSCGTTPSSATALRTSARASRSYSAGRSTQPTSMSFTTTTFTWMVLPTSSLWTVTRAPVIFMRSTTFGSQPRQEMMTMQGLSTLGAVLHGTRSRSTGMECAQHHSASYPLMCPILQPFSAGPRWGRIQPHILCSIKNTAKSTPQT